MWEWVSRWGVISANINFQILLCHSPMLLFSFLRNSFTQLRILLFPFEFCYSLFWFYYAIMNSLIQFSILLFAFEFCYAIFQFYNSIVQSSHAVSNPAISFEILSFSFLILLAYVIMNSFIHFPIVSIIRFRILCSSTWWKNIVNLAVGPLGTSNKLIKTWQTCKSTFYEIDYEYG